MGKWNNKEQEATEESGVNGDTMSFVEIAERMNLSVFEVKKIYNSAMRKLKAPNQENQTFWEYNNISENDTSSDMSGSNL